MKVTEPLKDLPIGYQFPTRARKMTQERMTVYSDMEASCCVGDVQIAEPNIHTDSEFAKSKGLPDTIADGLITTAWIESVLRDILGTGYIKGGSLMTKYIRPVLDGDEVTLTMILKDKKNENNATRLLIDIVCTNQKGEAVVVGSASGLTPRQ